MTDPHGLDVIDHAAALIAAQIRTATHIQDDRDHDPASHPEYGPTISPRTVALRAVGDLLKAGMLITPLTEAEIADIRRQQRRRRRSPG